jgi:hypothetical protein
MRRLLIALPVLSLLAGCGLFFAEAEIPATTIHLGNQYFTGGNPLLKTISIPIGDSLPLTSEPDLTLDLRLTAATVTLLPGSPMPDFGDIKDVTITVVPAAGSTLSPAVLARYTQSPSNPAPTSITVAGLNDTNLAPYLSAGTLDLQVKADSVSGGGIPDWLANFDTVVYLKARADYGDMIGKKL